MTCIIGTKNKADTHIMLNPMILEYFFNRVFNKDMIIKKGIGYK